jgi:hypothetical protein
MNFLVYRAIVYRCLDRNPKDTMQNKKVVQIVVWLVVIGMVMGLLFSVIALL